MSVEVDLGSGFSIRYFGWHPDRNLNPGLSEFPDVEKAGVIVRCAHGTEGAVHFNVSGVERLSDVRWDVQSWDPLTISPSVDAGCCHGYIRDGKWSYA